MRFFQSALTLAAVAATAFAQSSVLFFTEQPSSVAAGKSVTLHFKSANPTTPTTILLRKGMSNALMTISTITDSAVDGTFVWNVPSTLASGDDYALELTQGSEINYSSLFTISGTSSASSSSTGSTLTTSSCTTSVYPTLKPSHTKPHNSSVILGTGASMPYAYPTAGGTGSGFGNRNGSSYASPTLTPGVNNNGPTGLVGGPMTTNAAGTTVAAATAAQKTGAASRLDSSFALIFGAVAAIAYLN